MYILDRYVDNRKAVTVTVLSLIFIVLCVIFYLWYTTATILIKSSGADIYVSEQKDRSSFKKIGFSEAAYRTRTQGNLYIEARGKQGQATQKPIQPKRRTTTTINLTLNEIIQVEPVTDLAFTYPLITKGYIFGINGNTNSLSMKSINNSAKAPLLPYLPELKKVIWYGEGDFAWVSYNRQSGYVNNWGKTYITEGDEPLPNIDIDRQGNTTALLSNAELRLSTGNDPYKSKRIASALNTDPSRVFVSPKYISMTSFNTSSASSEEGVSDIPTGADLTVYTHSGVLKQRISLPKNVDIIYKVEYLGDEQLGVLSDGKMYVVDIEDGSFTRKDFAFGTVNDLVAYKGRILLMGNTGLWSYDLDKDNYYRVANYANGETYVDNSLTVLDDQLYFSSSLKGSSSWGKPDTQANNRMYRVDL